MATHSWQCRQSSWCLCWCHWSGHAQHGLDPFGLAGLQRQSKNGPWGGAQAQSGAQAAQQQEAVYRAALQELTLFKSRTSAALLQARASMRLALR